MLSSPPTGQRSVVQAICLLVMAFCTYGLFAFFQTTLIKCSDTTSFPVTSVSAHISPDVQPLDAAPPSVKYITKSIQDIVPGDTVYAYDIDTGAVAKRPVTSIVSHQSDHLRHLTVRGASGLSQTFQTTDTHPFWVVSDSRDLSRLAREYVTVAPVGGGSLELYHANAVFTDGGYYVEASDLRLGDVFQGPHGELTTLIATHREDHPDGISVYNIEVDGTSNYYVIANYEAYLAGAEPALVHNATCTWYHGTDPAAATDILQNGLSASKRKSILANVPGFYVTDDIGMAMDFARFRNNGQPGSVLEFSDSDIGQFLRGNGRNNEAFIPLEYFGKIPTSMIRLFE